MKRFVKLREPDARVHSKVACCELELARRELSPSGVYRVLKTEEDCGERFYLLVGGKAWYSAALFDEVSG